MVDAMEWDVTLKTSRTRFPYGVALRDTTPSSDSVSLTVRCAPLFLLRDQTYKYAQSEHRVRWGTSGVPYTVSSGVSALATRVERTVRLASFLLANTQQLQYIDGLYTYRST